MIWLDESVKRFILLMYRKLISLDFIYGFVDKINIGFNVKNNNKVNDRWMVMISDLNT